MDYSGYFRRQFGCTFSAREIDRHAQFLYNQLRYGLDRAGGLSLSSRRVLEVGSGRGSLAKLILAAQPVDFVGIELDPEAVAATNSILGRYFLNLSLRDYYATAKRSHDTVFAFEVLEHVADPLGEIRRIYDLLDPSGVFIGTSPYPYRKNILADETHLYVLHPTNWARLCAQAGFESVTTWPMSFFPVLWRMHRQLNPVIPWYVPFPAFISTTLIVARKGCGSR